jgi:hypothetical protein
VNRFEFVADHQARYGVKAVVHGPQDRPVEFLLLAGYRTRSGRA